MDIKVIHEGISTANPVKAVFQTGQGLNEATVRAISKQKNEPEWMLQKRLRALKYFQEKPMPTFGPDLSKLDLNKIVYYHKAEEKTDAKKWEDVPEEIRTTFQKLGIPEAEHKALAGVGGQYDSEMIYHNLKEEWAKKGVIFENFDVALKKYPEMIKKYFMTKCVPINDHKFAALHAAVWSGGTFIYIPPGVKVEIPLQAYFRMNSPGTGQFEHTLIIVDKGAEVHYIEGCSAPQYNTSNIHAGCVEVYVMEGARARYSSVENWSKNTYNLNTKRSIVEKDGYMEWIGGNLGSGVTMLYPCSVLKGERSRADHLSIAYAGKGQNQDTGAKVIHLAPKTKSVIISKSISKDDGITTYRGLAKITKLAKDATSSVKCDALLLDEHSVSNTVPKMEVFQQDSTVAHEATVGKISQEQIFYLMSRGLSEEEAEKMIVSGFIEAFTKLLPVEYAVEFNRLIELEMEGSVG